MSAYRKLPRRLSNLQVACDKVDACLQVAPSVRPRVGAAIATALANDPPLLLADEPTGELDTKTVTRSASSRRLNEAFKRTILVVTHDRRVANIAHRVIQIEDGKIVSEAA